MNGYFLWPQGNNILGNEEGDICKTCGSSVAMLCCNANCFCIQAIAQVAKNPAATVVVQKLLCMLQGIISGRCRKPVNFAGRRQALLLVPGRVVLMVVEKNTTAEPAKPIQQLIFQFAVMRRGDCTGIFRDAYCFID
jgi:hypothetical protein